MFYTDLKPNQAYLILDDKTRYYFTGLQSSAGHLFLTSKGKTLYIDSRYYYHANEVLAGKVDVKLLKTTDAVFKEVLSSGIDELFIDYSLVTVSEYIKLLTYGFKVLDGQTVLQQTMSVKTEDELKCIQKACDIAFEAFTKTLPFIKTGVTESYVKSVLEDFMRKGGASGTSFDTIVAFGKNAGVPHHETSDAILQDNECVLMDFGCVYKNYCSDITRTMFNGTPDKKFLDAYNAVLKANILAEDNIYHGILGIDADKISRDYLESVGLAGYFTHSLGHGIGLNVHEAPTLSPKSINTLLNNMVFSIEPGVYFDGEFGIRIEDTVVLIDGKVQKMFNDDKNLIIL
ncbi:MAG: aminopeptidase P family protein [Clostridia bacterium]|nr:aminopeptidase P family protein [Clostridia bacterium]